MKASKTVGKIRCYQCLKVYDLKQSEAVIIGGATEQVCRGCMPYHTVMIREAITVIVDTVLRSINIHVRIAKDPPKYLKQNILEEVIKELERKV
jgi:hypothetical protein